MTAAYVVRGWAWTEIGEYEQALADLDEALRLNPKSDMAYNNRGWAWIKQQEYDRAIVDLDQALRLNPQLSLAYVNRSNAWFRKGERDKAVVDCDQALRLTPKNADLYVYRSHLRCTGGEYAKAIADCNEALALNPQCTEAYNHLAAIQSTCSDARFRDGQKALANVRRAHRLDGGKSFIYVCTLAEAYAENGDFVKAREWMEKAIAMAAVAKSVRREDAEEMRAALELFKQGKPYRQPGAKGKVGGRANVAAGNQGRVIAQ